MEEMNLGWYGMLTINNIEQVSGLLRELLVGKRYVFVSANEQNGFRPELRTGQMLASEDPITVHFDEENKRFAGLQVHDTYGVWGCTTSLTGDTHDPESKEPHFDFRWKEVTITHRNGFGGLLYWVVSVEGDVPSV